MRRRLFLVEVEDGLTLCGAQRRAVKGGNNDAIEPKLERNSKDREQRYEEKEVG